MADITKCTAKNCKIKDKCYRYTAYDGKYQSYANFNNDKEINEEKDCSEFWKDRRECNYNEDIRRRKSNNK